VHIAGVDPGKQGAIVIVNELGYIVAKSVMFLDSGGELDPWAYQEFLKQHKVDHVVIEHVHAIFGSGAKATFNFGMSFMFCTLIPKLMKLPYQLVLPTEWQKVMHKGMDKKIKAKQRSLIVAHRLWPNADLRASERCKAPHDGIVDALLISEWGRLQKLKGVG
jgi:hypothetical protein